MKNLLSENMLRFGTKNLSEAAQRELVLKSIIETINEHGLHNEIRSRLTEAQSTYEGSMDSLYQGLVNALNKPLKTHQTADPKDTKYLSVDRKSFKVWAWGKKGIGKPADPNMQGITDAEYYLILGPQGSKSPLDESITYLSTLMSNYMGGVTGPQRVGQKLTEFLKNFGLKHPKITPSVGLPVITAWVKTYETVPPPSKAGKKP